MEYKINKVNDNSICCYALDFIHEITDYKLNSQIFFLDF